MAQMVEHLPSKAQDPQFKLQYHQKKKKKTPRNKKTYTMVRIYKNDNTMHWQEVEQLELSHIAIKFYNCLGKLCGNI
jgi:proline dehydrogenase